MGRILLWSSAAFVGLLFSVVPKSIANAKAWNQSASGVGIWAGGEPGVTEDLFHVVIIWALLCILTYGVSLSPLNSNDKSCGKKLLFLSYLAVMMCGAMFSSSATYRYRYVVEDVLSERV